MTDQEFDALWLWAAPLLRRSRERAPQRRFLLAADAVAVAVKPVGIISCDEEASRGNVAAVQVGRTSRAAATTKISEREAASQRCAPRTRARCRPRHQTSMAPSLLRRTRWKTCMPISRSIEPRVMMVPQGCRGSTVQDLAYGQYGTDLPKAGDFRADVLAPIPIPPAGSQPKPALPISWAASIQAASKPPGTMARPKSMRPGVRGVALLTFPYLKNAKVDIRHLKT